MIEIGLGRLKIEILPHDILIGLSVHRAKYMCGECDEIHDIRVIQIGLLFINIGFII